jgi:hypothetical protein
MQKEKSDYFLLMRKNGEHKPEVSAMIISER